MMIYKARGFLEGLDRCYSKVQFVIVQSCYLIPERLIRKVFLLSERSFRFKIERLLT
jgi:hypothetical protein